MAAPATKPEKKFRSKWTCIAVEGATTDGRTIERSWLEDIASQYNPATYGARINCEHIKGIAPESPFGAYGDVLAVKTEEVEIDGKKKLALYAQLQPNEALLALNKKRQKVYTSIEVQPKFADTGKAYLIGLAITDSPASLGTEALEFSVKHGTLANRKQHPENLFTAAEEVELEFEEIDDTPSMFAALKGKVGDLLGKSKEKEGKDAANFNALGELIEDLATHGAEQAEAFAAEKSAREALQIQHDKLATEFADLRKTLENTLAPYTPNNPQFNQRPPVSGGDGRIVTDC